MFAPIRHVVLVAITAPSAVARADANDSAITTAAYAVTTTEVALATMWGADLFETKGAVMVFNYTPLVLGVGAGWAAYAADLDPRPSLAVHGAAWLGLDLLLLGTLIDGRHEKSGLRAGATAWTLATLGAVAGGVIGGTAVDGTDDSTAWLVAPIAGFGVGAIVIGGGLVLASGFEGDRLFRRLAMGAVAGSTIGLGVATYLAYRGTGETATTPRSLDPMVAGGRPHTSPPATIFSFGGRF